MHSRTKQACLPYSTETVKNFNIKTKSKRAFGVLTWGGIGFGLIFSVNTAQKNPVIRQYYGIFYVLS